MNKQIRWKWVNIDIYLVKWYRSINFELEIHKGFFLCIHIPFMGFEIDICHANNRIYSGEYKWEEQTKIIDNGE